MMVIAVSGDSNTGSSIALSELEEKIIECQKLCDAVGAVLTKCMILININQQRLYLLEDTQKQFDLNTKFRSYPISSAQKGTGQEEGTGKTPLGLHHVQTKIGDGADPFAVFKSRELTGEISKPEVGGNSIIGRILWLQGLQPGFNQGTSTEGKVVDTFERYIYIHGTNDLNSVGQPTSAGCIRMKPDDVIDLFNKTPEKSIVYIV